MNITSSMNKVVDSTVGNAVGPVVATSTFLGLGLSDWVYVMTLVWIGIQIGFKLRKEFWKKSE